MSNNRFRDDITVLASTLEQRNANGKRENSSTVVSMYRLLNDGGKGPQNSKLNRSST